MAVLKILVIPGSLRTGSFNARLAAAAVKELALANVDVTLISLGDFPLPIYDGDLEEKSGIPKNAVDLKRMIEAHHGVLIVTPEYNSSVPPLVKNTIDWVTRVRDRNETLGQVFRERAFAIGAASDGKFGGLRVLMALRQILALGCGATVIPRQIALSFAGQAFDDMDRLKDQRDADQLRSTVRQLIDVAQQMM
ncbi:NADPH-dependent FMN reductase [Afipia sp. Root123D2]|uniref:NADPH-dependent FMN reductase n=1 Tax=Afipia sp. Root123D2 TaxID=1736436 RepID=UPI00070164B7|nr:NAD(P)H-dependent oxidoreductase [Afipia sp. Root123D2]KQW19410.1 NADPH-dependent FMN reductase [Afipia sp. Root123D2]